jgi:hypothetical protein
MNYFAFWYILGALAVWLGIETRGRTLEEINATLTRTVRAKASGSRAPAV